MDGESRARQDKLISRHDKFLCEHFRETQRGAEDEQRRLINFCSLIDARHKVENFR
jgi:hypothetical protein